MQTLKSDLEKGTHPCVDTATAHVRAHLIVCVRLSVRAYLHIMCASLVCAYALAHRVCMFDCVCACLRVRTFAHHVCICACETLVRLRVSACTAQLPADISKHTRHRVEGTLPLR